MPLSDEVAQPVVGSFVVDGLTYAIVGEGRVALVAVSPRMLADGLAGGSAAGLADASDGGSSSAPSGEGSGSGVPPRSEAGQVPSGAALPSPSPEEASSDGAEDEDASDSVILEVPGSVDFDDVTYIVVAIGPRALAGCDADVVTIPAAVESVDELAFRGSAVAAIEVADGNPSFSSYDGMLFDADQTSLLLIPEGKQGAARIPKTASSVPPDALSHCASVTSVEVEAGSAAYYSENGSLYDMTDKTLLWAPSNHDAVVTRLDASMAVGLAARDNNPHATFGINGNGGYVQGFDRGKQTFKPTTLIWGDGWSIGQLEDGEYVGWQVRGNLIVYPPHDQIYGRNATRIEALPRDGYSQEGWLRCTNPGAEKENFEKLSEGAGYTAWGQEAYVNWVPNTYTVQYYDRTGTIALGTNPNFKYDEEQELPHAATAGLTSGYTAKGWSTDKMDSEVDYKFGESVKNLATSGTVSLYVAEEANMYALGFAIYPGTGKHSPAKSVTFDGALPDIEAEDPVWAGHTFEGFYTTKPHPSKPGELVWDKQYYGRGGKKVAEKWDVAGDTTLQARYEPKTYKVKFHLTGGAGFGQQTQVDVTYGKDFPENADRIPIKNGYEFDGWWEIEQETYDPANTPIVWVTQYYDSTGASKDVCRWDREEGKETTFYARWKYIVKLEQQWDGARPLEPIDAYCDTDLVLPEPDKRPGYIFKGWSTKPDGIDGTTLDSGSNKAPNLTGGTYWHETTLYAQWEPVINVDVPIDVCFDLMVDFATQEVTSIPDVLTGASYEVGRFSSRSAQEIRVLSAGQEAQGAADCRRSALRWFAQGDEAKAANLEKVRLGLSADSDGAPSASASLAELYGGLGGNPSSANDLMSGTLDLSALGLSIPAGSKEEPGSLGVRYDLDCSGLPLEDVAISSEQGALLQLVYTIGLAGDGAS